MKENVSGCFFSEHSVDWPANVVMLCDGAVVYTTYCVVRSNRP